MLACVGAERNGRQLLRHHLLPGRSGGSLADGGHDVARANNERTVFYAVADAGAVGYVVASEMRLTWFRSLVAGISFRVLSKTHSPLEILKRLESLLSKFRSLLSSLPPAELGRHKRALSTNLLEPPKKLVGEAGMHWGEIVNETREWKRNRLYVEGVEETRQEDLERVFGEVCLGVGTEGRRSLSVMIYGKNHPMVEEGENGVEEGGREGRQVVWLREEDWLAFRTSRPLFPCSPAVLSSKY